MKKKYLLLFLLIILGAFLRFYRLSDWLYFNMDEERDAFIVKRILVNHHFTLIGGSVPGGIYLGPAFYYLSSLPLWISKLSPLGLGIVASALGVFSIWLIFKFGEKLFNFKVGLIAAALFSSSYLMVIYNRHFWPLTPAPIVALITIFSLYKIIKEKNYYYCYLLAGALIVGLQSDPSNFTLILLTLFCWWFYRLPIKKKQVVIAFLMIAFSHLPLVAFDLRHDFLNSRALIKLLSFSGKGEKQVSLADFKQTLTLFPNAFSRLIYTFGDRGISRQLAPCFQYQGLRQKSIPPIFFIISCLILIYWLIQGFVKKDKKNIGLNLISLHLIITFLSIVLFNLLFPAYIREYFLSVLFPGFFLLLALSLEKLLQKGFSFLVIPLVGLLVFLNSKAVLTASNFLGFKNKMEAVRFTLEETGDEPFSLESLSSCFRYNGIRYLFYLAGKEPAKSFMDSHYSWLYDQPPAKNNPKIGVVFVSHDENESSEFWNSYNQYQQKTIDKESFGDLEVLIINNEKE